MKLAIGQNPADLVMDDAGIRTPEHQNFYVRAIWNAMLPNFFSRYDYITENDVSGEMLEALRLLQQQHAPDLQEGETAFIDYDMINKTFNLDDAYKNVAGVAESDPHIGREIKLALGRFAFAKKDGKIVVMDAYDFHPSGETDTIMQTLGTVREKGGMFYYPARYLGEKLFPAKQLVDDGYSSLEDSDYTQVRIELPEQMQTVDVDFDDAPETEVSDYVMQGPMTNKRQNAWGNVLSILAPSPAQAAD